MMEIDFMAGDISGNSTYSDQSENNSKTVSGNDRNGLNNEMRGEENNRNTGAETNTIGGDTGFETINESITLDSCISLGNSESEETAKENYEGVANKVTGRSAMGKDMVVREQAVTIRNEESDSDAEDDDKASIYSIELDSNITLGDETGKLAEMTDWDASRVAGVNEFEPAATSTQCVNTITIMEGKNRVDNKQRLIPKNYTQAMSGKLGIIWRRAIEKEMIAMAEHHVWDITDRPETVNHCHALGNSRTRTTARPRRDYT